MIPSRDLVERTRLGTPLGCPSRAHAGLARLRFARIRVRGSRATRDTRYPPPHPKAPPLPPLRARPRVCARYRGATARASRGIQREIGGVHGSARIFRYPSARAHVAPERRPAQIRAHAFATARSAHTRSRTCAHCARATRRSRSTLLARWCAPRRKSGSRPIHPFPRPCVRAREREAPPSGDRDPSRAPNERAVESRARARPPGAGFRARAQRIERASTRFARFLFVHLRARRPRDPGSRERIAR